jgi:hypothetical protein
MNKDPLINWLLAGDVSIQYQVHRDLLGSDRKTVKELQNRIHTEGWGKRFLSKQLPNGHWGHWFYQPKWTSTHYTLLDLKHLGIKPSISSVQGIMSQVLELPEGEDGGINLAKSRHITRSDICINGMILNQASYFLPDHPRIHKLVDYLMKLRMGDFGWNCGYYRGATHSSLHTTLSVLEGLLEYRKSGSRYRLKERREAEKAGIEFILEHRLYRSSTTGEVIDKRFTMLSYPPRWRFDILRCLDHFQFAGIRYDPRMSDALGILQKKRRPNGRWPLQAKHPGAVHFDMEKTSQYSRWNTLRAMRVLNLYGKHID